MNIFRTMKTIEELLPLQIEHKTRGKILLHLLGKETDHIYIQEIPPFKWVSVDLIDPPLVCGSCSERLLVAYSYINEEKNYYANLLGGLRGFGKYWRDKGWACDDHGPLENYDQYGYHVTHYMFLENPK